MKKLVMVLLLCACTPHVTPVAPLSATEYGCSADVISKERASHLGQAVTPGISLCAAIARLGQFDRRLSTSQSEQINTLSLMWGKTLVISALYNDTQYNRSLARPLNVWTVTYVSY